MSDKSYLDWPFFDDAPRAGRELEDWGRRTSKTRATPATWTGLSRPWWPVWGKSGWLRYAVPGAFGGARARRIPLLCLIREILARHSGLADFAFAMQGLGSGAITLHGSKELKQRYLPRVASGEWIAAFALSEPEAGRTWPR